MNDRTKELLESVPSIDNSDILTEIEQLFEDADKLPDNKKCRVSAYICYEDSNDIEVVCKRLASMADDKRGFLVSPLHDNDYKEDGTLKKPHYHIMFIMSQKTNTTVKAMRRFGELMGFVGCEIVHNCRAMARYLCHLDNKDKTKYNVDLVRSFGIEYRALIGSTEDKYQQYKDIIDFINENDIMFYNDLVDYCKANNDDWFRFIFGGATFNLEKYIRERLRKYTFLNGNKNFSPSTTTDGVRIEDRG